MGKGNDVGAGLERLLVEKAGAAGTDIGRMQAQKLLDAFAEGGIAQKGAVVSGYSERGLSGTVTLGLDLGKPLFPAATAGVNLSGSVEQCQTLMLLLSRFPGAVDNLYVDFPVNLTCMLGKSQKASLNLSAELGVKAGVEGMESEKEGEEEEKKRSGFDGKGLEISKRAGSYRDRPWAKEDTLEALNTKVEAKLVAEAKLGITGRRILLRDASPACYLTMADPRLLAHFQDMLGPGDKTAVKNGALAVFDRPELTPAARKLKPEKSLFKQLVTGGNVEYAIIEQQLEALRILLDADRANTVRPELCALGKHDEIIRLIEEQLDTLRVWYAFSRDAVKDQASRRSLEALLDGRSITNEQQDILRDIRSRFCVLDLWGAEPVASATIKGEATAQIAGQAGTAGFEVGGEGGMKETRYRYQNFVHEKGLGRTTSATAMAAQISSSDALTAGEKFDAWDRSLTPEKPLPKGKALWQKALGGVKAKIESPLKRARILVATQDTRIRYIQAKLKASGAVTVGNRTLFSKEAEKTVYNSMRYRSAVAYWIPSSASDGRVKLEVGSGFTFGASFVASKLFRRREQAAMGEASAQKFMAEAAHSLHVTPLELSNFVAAAEADFRSERRARLRAAWNAATLQKEADEAMEKVDQMFSAVLVEASFALDRHCGFPDMALDPESAVHGVPSDPLAGKDGFFQQMEKRFSVEVGHAQHPKLQTLRLRVRLVDLADNTKTKFKLGLKYIVEAGIELKSVDRAGYESIIDIFSRRVAGKNDFMSNQAITASVGAELGVRGMAGTGIANMAAQMAAASRGMARPALSPTATPEERERAHAERLKAIFAAIDDDTAVPPVALLHQ